MGANETVFESGMRDTRAALSEWNRAPWAVLRGWVGVSAAVAAGLLLAVWVIAGVVTPDPIPVFVPGISDGGGVGDVLQILVRNLVVLALHATACVAGFMAGSSMPQLAEYKQGFSRTLHLNAGRIAIFLVVVITGFSLVTQAYALGLQGASLADRLEIGITPLMVSVIPHALPELTALFLPLAAWMIASRRGQWHQLLAATVITVIAAIPVLVISAVLEVEVWPRILETISPIY
jgi:hypothetical protein